MLTVKAMHENSVRAHRLTDTDLYTMCSYKPPSVQVVIAFSDEGFSDMGYV
jgi:hypothetical protein